MAGKPQFAHRLPEIVELRQKGESLGEISRSLSISIETVRNMLHRSGNFEPLLTQKKEAMDYHQVDPAWWSEFRGFFYGEGSVYFRDLKTSAVRRKLVPVLQISVRKDDAAVVESIHQNLGGVLQKKQAHGPTNEAVSWLMTGWARVQTVSFHLLDGLLPSKKHDELRVMLEACEKRFTMSRQLSEAEREVLYVYHFRLRKLKLLRC